MAALRLGVFQSRRILVTSLLGFSSGTPLHLTGSLLAARLAYEGVDIKTIGAVSMIALAYTFKPAWAPLIDLVRWPFLGRRRGWLFVLQLALVFAIAALGMFDPHRQIGALALTAIVVAFLSASQDIVVDAYNADSLRTEERAAGGAAYLMGYRAATLLTGIAVLWVGFHAGWQVAYSICAAMMLVGMTGTLLGDEPPPPEHTPSIVDVIVQPFWKLLTQRRIYVTLPFVFLYRFSEFLVLGMIYKFLRDAAFTKNELVVGYQVLGFLGTLGGGALGGMLVARYGVRRCLVPFGILFSATNLFWAVITQTGHSMPVLIAGAVMDHAASAMGAGAFVAFLMSRTDRTVSATQYALLTSLSSLGGRLLGFVSALYVEDYGWASFWIATTAIVLPALVLVPFLPDDEPKA